MNFEQMRVNNYLGIYNPEINTNQPTLKEVSDMVDEDLDSKVVSITKAINYQKGESGFRLDLKEAIMNEGNLNEPQAQVVLNLAWEVGYDESYNGILIVAKAYTYMAKEISRLK